MSGPWQDALIEAVREAAAAEIMPRFRDLGEGDVDTKSGPDDLVTVADLAAERVIAAAAARILPGCTVVGEEGVAADPALMAAAGRAETCVIVDPIDGTSNYAAGLATFGVIVAVLHGPETVFGLLYDPVCDDWVRADAGAGARLIQPGRPEAPLPGPPEVAMEAAQGYVPIFHFPPHQRAAMADLALMTARAGTLRCSCHEYRQLAMGRVAYAVTGMLKPWDHAAGALIMRECGAAAVLADGRPYAPGIHEGAMAVARPALARRLAGELGARLGRPPAGAARVD